MVSCPCKQATYAIFEVRPICKSVYKNGRLCLGSNVRSWPGPLVLSVDITRLGRMVVLAELVG